MTVSNRHSKPKITSTTAKPFHVKLLQQPDSMLGSKPQSNGWSDS